MAVFPVKKGINACNYDVLSKAFPTKQEDIEHIINYARTNRKIDKIIIFGSSVTWNCKVNSDIDIAIKLSQSDDCETNSYAFADVLSSISKIIKSDFDLLDYDKISNEHLKRDIDKKGVVVYAHIAQKSS